MVEIIINVSYVLLAVLALCYLYYLFSPKAKKPRVWRRNKQILKILYNNSTITRRQTVKIATVFDDVKKLFFSDATADYQKMYDTLVKIKNKQQRDNTTNGQRITDIIDILCEKINSEHKYFRVNSELSQVFINLENSILGNNMENIKGCLELLYTQSISVEKTLKKRWKKEFWIATGIAILGIALSVLQMINK
ncbi:hypothetical protein FACS1894190_11360 [Spirochaetia bacterium]|nr:hypothetical protein FACS1894190_11360 [Spirochaetia bacterium]